MRVELSGELGALETETEGSLCVIIPIGPVGVEQLKPAVESSWSEIATFCVWKVFDEETGECTSFGVFLKGSAVNSIGDVAVISGASRIGGRVILAHLCLTWGTPGPKTTCFSSMVSPDVPLLVNLLSALLI